MRGRPNQPEVGDAQARAHVVAALANVTVALLRRAYVRARARNQQRGLVLREFQTALTEFARWDARTTATALRGLRYHSAGESHVRPPASALSTFRKLWQARVGGGLENANAVSGLHAACTQCLTFCSMLNLLTF